MTSCCGKVAMEWQCGAAWPAWHNLNNQGKRIDTARTYSRFDLQALRPSLVPYNPKNNTRVFIFCIQVDSDKKKIVRLYITASFFGLCRYTPLSDGFFPLWFGENDTNIYSWYSIRTSVMPVVYSHVWDQWDGRTRHRGYNKGYLSLPGRGDGAGWRG